MHRYRFRIVSERTKSNPDALARMILTDAIHKHEQKVRIEPLGYRH